MSQVYDAELKLLVDGAWRGGEGREVRPVFNPATGGVIGQLPVATAVDLDEALAAAERAWPAWRARTPEERGALMHAAAALVRQRSERIATVLTMEQGRPIEHARFEVGAAAGLLDYFAEQGKRIDGRVVQRPSGQRAMVLRQPIGPVACFSPWNFPVNLMMQKVAPALAAGCVVIAKPPEETPASTCAVVQCLLDAGIPGDVVQVVFGQPDMISRHLLGSPVIRKVSFTGSTAVGQQLMRLAADNVQRITMELGGHAPVLVFDDCDLEATLDKAVMMKFRNAGQICISPTRFHVQEGIYEAFVKGFAERAARIRVGDGLDPATEMGPLANARRLPVLKEMVADARDRGARVVTGGEAGGPGYFFAPTVLADMPVEAQAMNVEPFGPMALMRPFASEAEAIEQANRLPYGLAAYVFAENGRRINRVVDAIESGMVGVNGFGVASLDMPFGGVKQSGFGSESGPEGLEAYLVTKAVHVY